MDLTRDYDLELVERKRRVLGLTKPEIARRCELSVAVVYKVLDRGKGSAKSLLKIAEALGMEIDDVVREPEIPASPSSNGDMEP